MNDVHGRRIVNDTEKANYLNNYFLNSVEELKASIPLNAGDDFNSLRTLYRTNINFSLDRVDANTFVEIIRTMDANKTCWT